MPTEHRFPSLPAHGRGARDRQSLFHRTADNVACYCNLDRNGPDRLVELSQTHDSCQAPSARNLCNLHEKLLIDAPTFSACGY